MILLNHHAKFRVFIKVGKINLLSCFPEEAFISTWLRVSVKGLGHQDFPVSLD